MTTGTTNVKRKIAILAVFCMMFSLMPVNAFAAQTSDISNHWAKDNIQSWVDKGLIKGYEDGTFRPDRNISRAEFITLVNGAFGYIEVATINYTDVKADAWYANAIVKAKAAGYISGYPDGTMKPDNPISREEAATIVMKINKLEANPSAANTFTDSALLSWSKGAVGAVFAAGIMEGYPDGNFGSQKLIKRGEATISLDRAMKYEAAPIITPSAINLPTGGDSHDADVAVSAVEFLTKPTFTGAFTSDLKVKVGGSYITNYSLFFNGDLVASTTNGIVTTVNNVFSDMPKIKIQYNSQDMTDTDSTMGSW